MLMKLSFIRLSCFRNKQKIIILLSSVNLEFLIVHISI